MHRVLNCTMNNILLIVSVACCFSSVFSTDDPKDAVLTNYEYVRGPSNNYHFGFDSSDGTSRQEEGTDDEDSALKVKGAVTWVAQDGSTYQMFFNAGKGGYRSITKRISGPE